ncbi:MAG: GNAT family N-acetyltransferase [Candidatus Heimdallarchaeaceae archaeon]
MVIENKQIEMKRVNLFQWRSYKKNYLKLLIPSDPEIASFSSIMRFFMFIFFRITAENYFCYYNGKRAGVLSLRTKKGTDAFIYGIAVLPEFRKKGLGKFMMDFSEKRAKETQKKFMALAVLSSNEPAINLYKKTDCKFVGLGITSISITLDKITKSESNSIKLERIPYYTDEFKDLYSDIVLSQIETVSQNDGVEYMLDNRIDAYHKNISKNISKAKYQFLHVLDNDEHIGFLSCRDKKTKLSCSVYLQSKTILTIELITNLAEKLKNRIKDSEDFEKLEFRVFLHQADKMIDLQKSNFARDTTLDKKLMFKKI